MMTTSMIKQSIKTSVLSAIFTVLLLMLVNYFFNHSWNLFAGANTKQLFTVEGTSSITQKPDQADINFTVSKTATNLTDAQSAANTLMNTIVSDLQKMGIAQKDIKTSNYSSNPTYDNTSAALRTFPYPGDQTITGYIVSENVDVSLKDTTKAGSVIDTITKDGAQNISGPNLSFSQTTQQSLITKARLQAVMDARQKAEGLAKAAGINLGRIVNIQETNNNPYPLPIMYGKALNTSAGIPTKINQGENTITENVTLSYETW